ncbi:MAG: hypothetical protein H5T98_04790 [Syntrophomonadaceae bacterium]|nr:hypothetical protein [Syntrophomonadaceae bacterium]
MGNCKYCGQPAGFLRSQHKECAAKHDQGWQNMIDLAEQAARGLGDISGLRSKLASIASYSFIPAEQINEAIIRGWEQAVTHFIEDGDLSAEEEKQLTSFATHFALSQNDLDQRGIYTQFVKGAVLREVIEGNIPERVKTDTPLPFNFQKSESLIWVFDRVDYYEDKTRRQYVGGSSGVSFRVAKGVYFRTGGFRGRPVETTERVHLGTGIMAVTNKHIYFTCSQKTFRVRLDKIVSFTPFSDGVGIQRDAATAKPQFFITGDGWFTYNLLMNAGNVG